MKIRIGKIEESAYLTNCTGTSVLFRHVNIIWKNKSFLCLVYSDKGSLNPKKIRRAVRKEKVPKEPQSSKDF